MDDSREQALERARQRIADARAGKADTAQLEAQLERSRVQLLELARSTDDLRDRLPEEIGSAVQQGLRREVAGVTRSLAEIRGLLNGAIRRLDRLEEDLLSERHARIDDLALLVDLISSGWEGVDERLRRIEGAAADDVVSLRGAA